MGQTSHISCISDAFFSYRVYFYLIYQKFYHSTNYISLMMIMKMMGLDPGPLVRAIFHFALEIPLVVSVAQGRPRLFGARNWVADNFC